jgi:hypothetical protein
MAALCQPQRVSIAETYTQLVGGGGVDAIWQQPEAQPPSVRAAAGQPTVSGRASIRESTPALQRAGNLSGTVRPFDPAGVQAARQQRRASMAASIERARRIARAKWEAERPSILAELKQNRPPSSDDRRRQTSSQESSTTSSEPLGGVWKPPPAAAPEAGGDRAADEELARLRVQMQQMKQYVSTMEAMIGQQLASQAVAVPPVGETARPPGAGINPDSQPQVPLAPVVEDSVAEVESPQSNVDLDTQLLFETFETARHACAEVSEAEAEHGDMLERVSSSPLAKDKTREQSPVQSPLPAASRNPQVPPARSPLGMLSVDPNNAATRTSASFARLQSTKQSDQPVHTAGRGPVCAEPPARAAASPNLSSTDGGSPAAVVTYTEYSEYEEYADSSDGSPAAPGGVQVGAAVVEDADKALTVASEPVVMRGRLSF